MNTPYFDFDKHTIFDALEWLNSPFREDDFRTIQNGFTSRGNGATRQAYQRLGAEIITKQIMIQTGYFAEVNPDHDIWQSNHVVAFCKLLKRSVYYDCTLPFHLSPCLLEAITDKTMTESELEFYAEKIDPDMFRTIAKLDTNEFAALETEFESKTAAYRHICSLGDPAKTSEIHAKLATNLRDSRKILELDEKFSGKYVITPEMVNDMITFRGYDSHHMMWNNFVATLDHTELESMIRIFGNTTSMRSHYVVKTKYMTVNFNACVCAKKIRINITLFNSADTLDGLRMYFRTGDDKIRG